MIAEKSTAVCHMWELGGGTLFSNLLDYVITTENLPTLAIVLCVDLSLPNELIATMETLVDNMRQRIETITSRENNYLAKESMRQKSRSRFGEAHEDLNDVNPFLVPLVIVGTKYDIFQGFEAQQKKVISRYLRLAAHTKGAALYFTSTKSEVTMNRVKNVVLQLAFGGTEKGKAVQDLKSALAIPFGSDSFQLIGQVSLDSGRAQLVQMFPNQEVSQFVIPDNPGSDRKFAERDIDLVRGVRDKELEDFRRTWDVKQEIGTEDPDD